MRQDVKPLRDAIRRRLAHAMAIAVGSTLGVALALGVRPLTRRALLCARALPRVPVRARG